MLETRKSDCVLKEQKSIPDTPSDHRLVWRHGHQKLMVEAYGKNSLRVRATLWPSFCENVVPALLDPLEEGKCTTSYGESTASITNGSISCQLEFDTGNLSFFRNGKLVLREKSGFVIAEQAPARRIKHAQGELLDIAVDFDAMPVERFYGLGQNPNGSLNQKGNRIEFRQRNGTVSIPFLVSSELYGLFWNNPGLGEVSLGHGRTEWRAPARHELYQPA